MSQQNQNRPAPATQGGGAPAVVKPAPKDALGMLNAMKGEIAKALPRHMHPDRLARICTTELRRVPKLGGCDPMSFIGAVVQCAQLGLEPGSGLGHAYLIPYQNRKLGILECQFIVGYRGLIDLSRRSGKIDGFSARIVWSSDLFEYEYGDDERIKHKPFEGPENERGTITHAYSIARIKGALEPQREVMSRAQINFIRQTYGNNNPVWEDFFDEMARKTVVRRISKYLPLSPEHAEFFRKDDLAGNDTQENWRLTTPEGADLLTSYEPQPAQHDAAKIIDVQTSGTDAPPPDAVNRAEAARAKGPLDAAMQELADARRDLEAAGMKADDLLRQNMKKSLNDVLISKDAKLILAAADVLKGAVA
jgi:recombination protein RecT